MAYTCDRMLKEYLTPLRDSGGGGVLPVFSYRNLQDFIRAASPISACYYCYGSEGEQVTPGAQMTKQELAEIK